MNQPVTKEEILPHLLAKKEPLTSLEQSILRDLQKQEEIKRLDQETKEAREKMGMPSIQELQEYLKDNITKEEYMNWKTAYAQEKKKIPKMTEQEFIFKCVVLHYMAKKLSSQRSS